MSLNCEPLLLTQSVILFFSFQMLVFRNKIEMNFFATKLKSCTLRPAETEASPYAGYQLAYEVKKLMYDKTQKTF